MKMDSIPHLLPQNNRFLSVFPFFVETLKWKLLLFFLQLPEMSRGVSRILVRSFELFRCSYSVKGPSDTFLFLGGHTANLRNFEFRIRKKPEMNVQAFRHLLSPLNCRACNEDFYHDSCQLQIFAAIDSCRQHSDDTDMYILSLIRNFLLNFLLPFLSSNFILSHRAFGQSNTF